MTSQTSTEARKLMRIGRDAVLHGLPVPTNEPPWIGAGLLMFHKLRDDGSTRGASDAAGFALDLLEATMSKRTTRQPIACTRGCSYCCKSVVSITAPEVFHLARWLWQNKNTSRPELAIDAVLTRIDQRAELPLNALLQQRLPCVLLIDDACSVYTARPSNCRRLLSSSVEACKADYEGVPVRIPVIEEAMQKGTHIRALLLAAVAAAGLSTMSYELSQALAVALRDANSEQRWLAGEDVFADVARRQELGTMQSAVDHWSSRIKRVA